MYFSGTWRNIIHSVVTLQAITRNTLDPGNTYLSLLESLQETIASLPLCVFHSFFAEFQQKLSRSPRGFLGIGVAGIDEKFVSADERSACRLYSDRRERYFGFRRGQIETGGCHGSRNIVNHFPNLRRDFVSRAFCSLVKA